MSDFTGFFMADVLCTHLVVGPEGSVDQQAIRLLHGVHDMWFDFAQARRIKDFFAAGHLFDDHTDIVAIVRIVTVRRVGRRLTFQRLRVKPQILDAGDGKTVTVQRDAVMVDGAIMLQHFENRKAGAEILFHHVATINIQRFAFSEHQQTGGVVDLTVDQHDRFDAGIAYALPGLNGGKGFELFQDVGRSIEQQPVPLVGTDRDRGLGAGSAVHLMAPDSMAIMAVAVPLRKAAAGGRAENSDLHNYWSEVK